MALCSVGILKTRKTVLDSPTAYYHEVMCLKHFRHLPAETVLTETPTQPGHLSNTPRGTGSQCTSAGSSFLPLKGVMGSCGRKAAGSKHKLNNPLVWMPGNLFQLHLTQSPCCSSTKNYYTHQPLLDLAKEQHFQIGLGFSKVWEKGAAGARPSLCPCSATPHLLTSSHPPSQHSPRSQHVLSCLLGVLRRHRAVKFKTNRANPQATCSLISSTHQQCDYSHHSAGPSTLRIEQHLLFSSLN